jgi:ferric-dicitrate binding protein FerR (iron transport regulator)
MKILRRRWWLAAAAAVAVAVSAVLATVASAGAGATSAKPGGLGQSSGLLPRDHLTTESAIQVNLSKETVRLPLYPGTAYAGTPHAGTPHAEKVWYVLLDASDPGWRTTWA